MKMEKHVLKAINAYYIDHDKDMALFHAVFALEGTAKRLFSKITISRSDYKSCIRTYWWIIERFIGEGLNLEETRFEYLKIDDGHDNVIKCPDLADVIYHIFRCNHAHAEEIPRNFELIEPVDGRYHWFFSPEENVLRMPDSVIWALLAVSVFCKANFEVSTASDHCLTWGDNNIGFTQFSLRDWWGREEDLKSCFADKPTSRVKLNL
jgi:hypothetical protein